MPESAQFVAVTETDSAFTLPNPQTGTNDRHLQFDLAGLNSSRTVIVMFKVTAKAPVHLRMRVNAGTQAFIDFDFADPEIGYAATRSWHEIVPGTDFKPTANDLVTSVTGSGTVQLSDVVILYHSRS